MITRDTNAMTPKERVLTALDHKETDRLPFSWGFGINIPAKEALRDYLGMSSIEELEEYLQQVDDVLTVCPIYKGPADRGDYSYVTCVGIDEFGVLWKPEQDNVPFCDVETVEELDEYTFPSPDWWDFSNLKDEIEKKNSQIPRAVKIGVGSIFERACWMRGMENTLIDTVVNPELLHHLLRKITDYYLGFFSKALEASKGGIDIVVTADDLGSQQGLLMSPAAIEEFVLPYQKELNDLVHGYGAKVMFHSCGSVTDAVPMLIENGIDILESLQLNTKGMDPKILKERFGDKLCFHGGASTQETLVWGTPEDVYNEAKWLQESLGSEGGFILAPTHHIQAGTPPENILALLKAAGRPLPGKCDLKV